MWTEHGAECRYDDLIPPQGEKYTKDSAHFISFFKTVIQHMLLENRDI